MDNFQSYDAEKNESQYKDLWLPYYELLLQHGIDNPIKSKAIEQALGIKGAAVRGLLSYGLHKGLLISTCKQGYFISKNKVEALPYLHHIAERIIALQNRLKLSEAILDSLPIGAEKYADKFTDFDLDSFLESEGI